MTGNEQQMLKNILPGIMTYGSETLLNILIFSKYFLEYCLLWISVDKIEPQNHL